MEPKKSTFDISRLLLDTVNTYEETADAIVPDTFPDLMRIAAVFGTPQLKDDVPQSGRVFLSGSIRMTVFRRAAACESWTSQSALRTSKKRRTSTNTVNCLPPVGLCPLMHAL